MSKKFFNVTSEKQVPTSTVPTNNCDECKLCESCSFPKLRFSGDGLKEILIVGAFPYEEEDRTGQFGRHKEQYFLIEALDQIGISFQRDIYYTTAVNCRPTHGKEPTTKNINLCRPRLLQLIERLNPKAIILLGDIPFDSLIYPKLSGRVTGMKCVSFVGEQIPDQEFKRYVCPVWHPSYLLSKKSYDDGNYSKPLFERDPSVYTMWKRHLSMAFEVAKLPFYSYNYKGDVLTTVNLEEACEWISSARSWEKMAFDFETTGKRPFREGHRIYSASISNGRFAYAFPFFNEPKFRAAWQGLMTLNVKKIAHNIQFEAMWNKVRASISDSESVWPEHWYWDTMNTAHCLDNQKPTGQKYLVYAKYGEIGYDDEIDSFLKASEIDEEKYGANAFNRIADAPLEKVLLYNGLDSLWCYKLFEYQNAHYLPFQKEGIDFFLESAETFVQASYNGFGIDEKILNEKRLELADEIQSAHQSVMDSPEVQQWDKPEIFNYDSSIQLGHLLFNILKVEPKAFTPTKRPSVDKEALPLYDVSIVQNILKKRHYSTILQKIEEYNRERNDAVVHPFFNLNRADTFRPSGDSPNLLNVFKRDEEAKKMVRSFLVPHRGNRIIEYDTKSAEVMVGAAYHHDPNMINYLTNESSDMHRDSACDCYLATWEEILTICGEKAKAVRQDMKSDFVFASFFGSYYKQTAPALWESAKKYNLIDHLQNKGIKTYRDFEAHIQKTEDKLWNTRFPVYKEWREKQWKFYQKHGYVDLLTGFRAYGPMSRNNSFNTPIQGTSYHLVQWTMNNVARYMKKMCKNSYQITQIYDSHVMDVHPSEEILIDKAIWLYGTQKIREYFDFLTIPIIIEKERSEVDQSWANMQPCGVLNGEGFYGN